MTEEAVTDMNRFAFKDFQYPMIAIAQSLRWRWRYR